MNFLTKFLLSTFYFLLSAFSYTQNLVPNPSFESSFDCCITENSSASWTHYSESPDYFNSCNSTWCSLFSVPTNSFGYQNPRNGDGYYGLVTYVKGSEFHEIIGTPLNTTLTIGTKYFLSMYVSVAEDPDQSELVGGASDKLGMLFTTSSYTVSNPVPVQNFAHFYTNTIITDTMGWTRIHGSFIADSTYTHLAIGNFFDTTNTNTLNINGSVIGSYYYIEDVCVSTDSMTCVNPVGMEPIINYQNNYHISTKDNLLTVLSKTNKHFNVSMYDITGKLIFASYQRKLSFRYSTATLKSTIYIVRIYNNLENYTQKIFINH